MIRPIHMLFLAACSTASVQTAFPNSKLIEPLRKNPEILINQQGLAQHDLSVRGSSYTGTGVSINGLILKSPYSAHFNGEIPFQTSLLAAPEARTGLDNVSGHLVGTAAYNTQTQDDGVQTQVGIGSKERYAASVSAQAMGVGAFAGWENAHRIDYSANDLERYTGGAYAQLLKNDWQIDLLTGYQRKEFGAQGYYGIPSYVYAEDRFEDTLLFLGATHGELDDAYFRASGSWRQFDDRYTIASSSFESDVRSRFGAIALEGRTMEIQNISLNLRGDLENEQVDGDIGDHDRTRGSVLILPQFTYEHFRITAGLNSVFQTDESPEWLPQAGADWFVTDNSTLYASYTETIQQPDYQTLYYSDPYHVNNPFLDQQRAQNTEIGFRQFASDRLDWRVAAFYRRIENASDYVKQTATDMQWAATDLGTLHAGGLESQINYYPSDELEIRIYYQWIAKDDYDFYAGLYETDYPEHLLALSGEWMFTPGFQLFGAQNLRCQTGNPARMDGDFGADASLGLHWFPRFANNARLTFLVDNLWGTDFQAIPGLKPPGRTVSSGITVGW